jgi:hypothetical protein
LTFIEAGDNNIRNPDCKVVDAVIAVSPNNKLLLPFAITLLKPDFSLEKV